LNLGIGDDCAIYRPRGGSEDLLFTTDMLLEDIHFRRATHPPEDVGHKALARGLSDIAAMGGSPRFCLLSLAIPRWADQAWVDGFYRGFLRLAHRTATPLAGGDLASAERLACDVIVCGAVPRGQALLRAGAKPGDGIYVSGKLGGSALGLATGRGRASKRHLRPEPRLALGRFRSAFVKHEQLRLNERRSKHGNELISVRFTGKLQTMTAPDFWWIWLSQEFCYC
jgi:thiamine-monophosphate kinase